MPNMKSFKRDSILSSDNNRCGRVMDRLKSSDIKLKRTDNIKLFWTNKYV